MLVYIVVGKFDIRYVSLSRLTHAVGQHTLRDRKHIAALPIPSGMFGASCGCQVWVLRSVAYFRSSGLLYRTLRLPCRR